MVKDKDYKKLYLDLRNQFDKYLRHKKSFKKGCPKHCRYCREWYRDTIAQTKKIKNKQIRELLLQLYGTLWLNNSMDFDIIYYEFASQIK